jgi:hypothetical protein
MSLVIHQRPSVSYAFVGDVAIVLWSSVPTVPANRWLIGELIASFLPRAGTCIILVFLSPTVSIPDAETRKLVQETFRKDLEPVRRLVNVPLGSGLGQSLMRTALRTLAMLGDTRKVVSIASSIEEAITVARVAAKPDTPSGSALRSAIHEIFTAAGVPIS